MLSVRSWIDTAGLAAVALALVLAALTVPGCAHTLPPRNCADYAKDRLVALALDGMRYIKEETYLTRRGAVREVFFTDGSMVRTDAYVDGAVLMELGKSKGFKLLGGCMLGDREWYILTVQEPVKGEPGT